MEDFKTGDLLLFTEKNQGILALLRAAVKCGTHSNYTHVAMILRDPEFLDTPLKGLYVWESSWEGTPDPQDGKIKLGVQITPMEQILKAYKKTGHIYYRKMITSDEVDVFDNDTLSKIHDVVYDKPYDIVPTDWVEALIQKDPSPQKTSRFWCSALVGYIYTKCGILYESTDWSIMRPSDFALSSENLPYTGKGYLLETETKIQ